MFSIVRGFSPISSLCPHPNGGYFPITMVDVGYVWLEAKLFVANKSCAKFWLEALTTSGGAWAKKVEHATSIVANQTLA